MIVKTEKVKTKVEQIQPRISIMTLVKSSDKKNFLVFPIHVPYFFFVNNSSNNGVNGVTTSSTNKR